MPNEFICSRRNKVSRERGSKSFKKQFEALFDKTFNIYIEKLFFLSLRSFFFFPSALLFLTVERVQDDKKFHLEISSRNAAL